MVNTRAKSRRRVTKDPPPSPNISANNEPADLAAAAAAVNNDPLTSSVQPTPSATRSHDIRVSASAIEELHQQQMREVLATVSAFGDLAESLFPNDDNPHTFDNSEPSNQSDENMQQDDDPSRAAKGEQIDTTQVPFSPSEVSPAMSSITAFGHPHFC